MADLPLALEAERLARETHLAFADAADKQPEFPGHVCSWADTTPVYRETMIGAHAALLADLSRPASMDHAARLLAERVGLTVGATAPGWWLRAGEWHLGNGRQTVVFCPSFLGTDATSLVTTWDGVRYTPAPYLAGVTDPAAALVAALVAVSNDSTTEK